MSHAKDPADSDACAVSIHVVIEGDDSDGDSVSDFWEWLGGYDPYDANDKPSLPLRVWLGAALLLVTLGATGAWRVCRRFV